MHRKLLKFCCVVLLTTELVQSPFCLWEFIECQDKKAEGRIAYFYFLSCFFFFLSWSGWHYKSNLFLQPIWPRLWGRCRLPWRRHKGNKISSPFGPAHRGPEQSSLAWWHHQHRLLTAQCKCMYFTVGCSERKAIFSRNKSKHICNQNFIFSPVARDPAAIIHNSSQWSFLVLYPGVLCTRHAKHAWGTKHLEMWESVKTKTCKE